MPFSYRQVKDLYDQLKSAGATSVSLPEWSDQMNQLTGTDLYGEGRNDNILKQASVGLDRALESIPGLSEGSRSLGRSVGNLVGNPEAGADIGATLPRMTVNMLPYLIPGAGWGAGAARLGGAALLSGMESYTKTGSSAAGLVSGAMAAALPKVTDLAEQAVLRRMGVQALSGPITRELEMGVGGQINRLVTEPVNRLYPETLGQSLASYGTGQVAAAGLMEGQRWGEEAFSGQPLHNPFTTENLLNYTLGQLPFAGIHGVGKLARVKAPRAQIEEAIASTEKLVEQKHAQDALAEQTDIEKIPVVAPVYTPEQQAQIQERLGGLRQKQEAITSKVSQTPEDAQDLNDAIAADSATPWQPTATSALGAEQGSEHVGVIGKQLHETAKWRKILVSDDPSNPEELRGKVVEYSKGLREPLPKAVEGSDQTTFGVTSDPLWRTVKTVEDEANRQAAYAEARRQRSPEIGAGTPENPELPAQVDPAGDYFSHVSDLDRIETDVDAAKTPAQMQKALLGLRALQERAGLPELSDPQFERIKAKLIAKGAVGNVDKQVIKKQTAQQRRKLEAQEKARTEINEAEQWLQEREGMDDSQAIEFQAYANELAKSSARGADLVTSGKLTRMFYELRDAPQAIDRLKTQASEAIKSGKGVTKPKLVEEIKQAEEPLKDIGTEAAYEALGNASARQAFEAWPRKDETTFNDERKLFLKWADETGIPASEDIPDLVDTWSAEMGESPQDLKAQLEDFIERPHVKQWVATQEELLRKSRVHAPQPQRTALKAKEYVPAINILGQEFVGKLGEAHQDILNRYVAEHPDNAAEALVNFDSKENPNYFKKGAEIVTREQLQEQLGVKDSQGLRDLQAKEQATLSDPARAPKAPPKTYVSDVSAQQEIISRLTTDGHGLIAELLSDSDPQVQAQAKDLLAKFPEALSRIDSAVYEVPGSYAARRFHNSVGIFFDRSMSTAAPFVRNNIILHELLHGLTLHELANPRVDPKVIAELTALRKRLIEALPKELRARYEKAIDSGWYERYSQGEASKHHETYGSADMSELSENNDHAQLLYGLLNNDELVSQAFSARSMRNYMAKQKGSVRGESAYRTFTNWIKNFLGLKNVDGTALGDFIATTSQLLHNGEFLADFGNFGERYFENRSESINYARVQTDRALGIVADSSFGLDEPLTIAKALDLGSSQSKANTKLWRAKRDYEKLLRESPEDKAHIDSVLAELGHKDLDDLVTSAIGEGDDVSSALDLLPPEATRYVYEKLRDAHDVLDVIRAASSEKNKGMVNLANPKLLSKSVAPVLKNIKRALEHEKLTEQMGTALAGLSSLAPEGMIDALPSFAPKLEPTLNSTEEKGFGWFDKFMLKWEAPTQVARRIPQIAELVSKGRQLASNIRRTTHEALKWWAMDTTNPNVDVLTEESEKHAERIMETPLLRRGVEAYIHQNQVKGDAVGSVTILPENDPDIAKLKAKFSEAQWQDVIEGVNKASKVTQAINQKKVGILTQMEVNNGAKRLQLVTGLKTKDNITLANTMLEGIQKSADPVTAQEGQMLIQSVQQRIADPDALLDLYQYLKGSVNKINQVKAFYAANPAWATAQRMEQFVFKVFNKAGKPETLQASTRKEAQDVIAKGGYKLNGEIKDNWAGREDSPWQSQNLPPEMLQRMQELAENQFKILQKSTEITREEFDRSNPITQILREGGAANAIPLEQTPSRLLSQGAEKLPWLYNHIAWVGRESSYWNRALLRNQKDLYLRDIEIRNHPDLPTYVDTHIDNLLRPDPAFAQQANRFMASWFLPYNLAMHIINGVQPYVTHVSELAAINDGKVIDAYNRIGRAHKEAIDLKFGDRRWANPEHEWAHNEWVKDGQIGPHKFDDDAAAQETRAYRFMCILKKEAPKTLGQRLGSMADAYTTVGMWTFKGPEQMNAETALFAAFDLYREKGLSKQEALQKAAEFNGVVNFNEGRNQRGVGLYSSKSPTLRGAAMFGTALQSYTLGTTAQIIRYIRSGYFRPAGITAAESFAARRAAVNMLGMQFALAGTLGMPFVSGALALLNQAFPEFEVNRKLRELMNQFMSSDEANGNVLTDMAMTGVPSMMGWDMQSRFSLGNTLPGVSEVNGFQPENLMGPTANVVRNFINGTTGWAKGDPKATASFLPPAIRKLIEAGQAALSSGQVGGGIQDYQGRPLATPTRGEYAGALLGFQPKRLSDQNAAARMLKQSEEVLRTQESRFRQSQAEAVLQGNFGSVRQELIAKKKSEKDYDDVAAVRAIAQASEALAFPRDLRREGSQQGSKVRSELLGTFGGGGQASEVQRLEFRKRIEQGLGLQEDSRQELKLAQLMDGLKAQNPNATRLELKSAALEASRRASRQRELLPLESL